MGGRYELVAVLCVVFLTEQQAVFVNNENTFSEFQFFRPVVSDTFVPNVSISRVRRPFLSSADDLFMRIDFCSKYDAKLLPADRPPIDLSFVLDVSGRQVLLLRPHSTSSDHTYSLHLFTAWDHASRTTQISDPNWM